MGAIGTVLVAQAAIGAPWLFISLDGEDRILVYRRDRESGALSQVRSIETSGSPGSLFFDHRRQVLFAALRSNERLASFRFNEDDGSLRLISEIEVRPDPAYVSLDHSGKWLFSAYYVAGSVAVHSVRPDGALSKTGIWTPTADKAHAALTDPANEWLMVPHTGPNIVFMFRFRAGEGKLEPATPLSYATPPNSGPRHAVFHPNKPIVYTVNEQGGSVTTWSMDRQSGQLWSLKTWSTLPKEYEGSNACADLELTPDAKWLFASNRGHNSLASFKVDPESGHLEPAGRTLVEATPRQFSITPDGRHVYVAGQGSGTVGLYRLDPETGALQKKSEMPVGARPWWILAVDRP